VIETPDSRSEKSVAGQFGKAEPQWQEIVSECAVIRKFGPDRFITFHKASSSSHLPRSPVIS
jgi:hypothetical protein